jgi:hypothetical protein
MPATETVEPPAEVATSAPEERGAEDAESAAEEAEQATDEPADSATDDPEQEESDEMAYKIRCPVCDDKFKQPQGLHGHLRFSHNIYGDELDEVYEKAQTEEYMEFEDEGEEGQTSAPADGEDSTTEGRSPSDEPESRTLPDWRNVEDDEKAVSEAFDWTSRLDRMQEIREQIEGMDESVRLGPFNITRDEGCAEALEALDEIEMEVRERLGASDPDRELRQKVDESLDQMAGLVRCRRQRQAIEEKFSGDKADRRSNRLDEKEAEIRAHVRNEWGVGKPTDKLSSSDPVASIEDGDDESTDFAN